MSDEPNFEGHQPRDCGEHRTVGAHRAWCHDCGEWCYPRVPCMRCEAPLTRKLVNDLADVLSRMVVGWEPLIGHNLAEHPDVMTVMASYRDWKDRNE